MPAGQLSPAVPDAVAAPASPARLFHSTPSSSVPSPSLSARSSHGTAPTPDTTVVATRVATTSRDAQPSRPTRRGRARRCDPSGAAARLSESLPPPPGTDVRVRRLRHERGKLTSRVRAVNNPNLPEFGFGCLNATAAPDA